MCDGVTLLVQLREHDWSTLVELEDLTGLTVEEELIHNVYHLTLTTSRLLVEHRVMDTCMEQNMRLLIFSDQAVMILMSLVLYVMFLPEVLYTCYQLSTLVHLDGPGSTMAI